MTSEPRKSLTRATLRLANIGERYERARIADIRADTPQMAECKRVIEKYCAEIVQNVSKGVGLLLHGPGGHGKTHIAIAVLKVALAHRARGLFLAVDQLQETFLEKPKLEFDEDDIPIADRARRAEILVLDDLGQEHVKDTDAFAVRLLEALCRERTRRNKATIFTTNAKLDELEARYGDWIKSLLKEMVYPVLVKGVDWRTKKAEELNRQFKA